MGFESLSADWWMMFYCTCNQRRTIFFFPMAPYDGFISAQNGMEKVSLSVEEKKKGATLLENKV